jgi:hypothetical protein
MSKRILHNYFSKYFSRLNIVGNKNMIKSKSNVYGFRDSQAPSWLSGPRSDVPAEPPLIGPVPKCPV